MVDAVLKVEGLKGLILETFGAGNAPGGSDGALTRVFAEAIQRGTVIVNVTQCMTGTVSPLYEPAMRLKRAGVVPGHDLTSEAALAKLSYLLALPDLTTEDITRQMSKSLRGELTEQTQMAFVHPGSQLPTPLVKLAVLGYAVARGSLDEVQDCLQGNVEWMLNEGDCSGNTPLVSYRAQPKSTYVLVSNDRV